MCEGGGQSFHRLCVDRNVVLLLNQFTIFPSHSIRWNRTFCVTSERLKMSISFHDRCVVSRSGAVGARSIATWRRYSKSDCTKRRKDLAEWKRVNLCWCHPARRKANANERKLSKWKKTTPTYNTLLHPDKMVLTFLLCCGRFSRSTFGDRCCFSSIWFHSCTDLT